MAKSIDQMTDNELFAMLGEGGGSESLKDVSDEELMAAAGIDAPREKAKRSESEMLSDMAKGNTGVRFAKGLASPLIGALQVGANVGDKIADQIYGDDVDYRFGEDLNQRLEDWDASADRGQDILEGKKGAWDVAGFTGSMMSGGMLGSAIMSKLPAAANPMSLTLGEKLLRGAATGGGVGASMPVNSGDNFWMNKGAQAGLGTILGTGVSGVGHAGGRYAAPLFENPKKAAGKFVRETIGEDKMAAVLRELRRDINPLQGSKGSIGEVASPARSTKLSALSRMMDKVNSDATDERELMQNAARMGVVDDIAGGLDDAVAHRNELTGPMRERALRAAVRNSDDAVQLGDDIAAAESRATSATQNVGRAQQAKSEARARALNRHTGAKRRDGNPEVRDTSRVSGMTVPTRYSKHQQVLETADDFIDEAKWAEDISKATLKMKRYQRDYMKASGAGKLEGASIVKAFDGAIDDGIGSPNALTVLSKARNYVLRNLIKKDGTFDPAKMYQFRKDGINQIVDRLPQKPGSVMTVKELTSVRRSIDDVIDNASGGSWKPYLKAYEVLSGPVNKAQVGQVLQKAMKNPLKPDETRAGKFASTLDDEAKLLRDAGVKGPLDEVMGGSMSPLKNVRADLERTELTKTLANKAVPPNTNLDAFQLANPLLRPIMVINAGFKKMSNVQQSQLEKGLVEIFKRDPNAGHQAFIDAVKLASPTNRPLAQEVVRRVAIRMGIKPDTLPGLMAGKSIGG